MFHVERFDIFHLETHVSFINLEPKWGRWLFIGKDLVFEGFLQK